VSVRVEKIILATRLTKPKAIGLPISPADQRRMKLLLLRFIADLDDHRDAFGVDGFSLGRLMRLGLEFPRLVAARSTKIMILSGQSARRPKR
jgi:hypothetical protein